MLDGKEPGAGPNDLTKQSLKTSHYRIAVEYRFLGDQIAGHPGGWGFSFRLPGETVRSRKNRYRILDE